MHDHQRRFLDLAIERDALRFGEFTLKSGRVSPYFFNAGRFDSGAALARLGQCYAQALAAGGRDVPVAFNRKEAKAHGEGGVLIGAPLAGRVLVVDDVITAGTAIRESIEIIRGAGAQPCGVIIALDRQERGQHGARSAAEDVAASFSLPVVAIAGLDELLEFADDRPGLVEHKAALMAYRARYGSQPTT